MSVVQLLIVGQIEGCNFDQKLKELVEVAMVLRGVLVVEHYLLIKEVVVYFAFA